jgi:GTP-binding protein YchF
LILADLEVMTKRRDKLSKQLKGDKSLQKELNLANKVVEALENEDPVRSIEFSDEEKTLLKGFNLLTNKPVIYAANVEEDSILDDSNKYVNQVREYAEKEGSEVVVLSGKIESEIAELEDEEKGFFLEELGLTESGLDKLIQKSYKILGLISFLTTGPKETRAWTVKRGSTAPQAAGKIHTDFERGFIRAEVVSYDELDKLGSMVKVKEDGKLRLEGKEYIVKDGDVILFRFNV